MASCGDIRGCFLLLWCCALARWLDITKRFRLMLRINPSAKSVQPVRFSARDSHPTRQIGTIDFVHFGNLPHSTGYRGLCLTCPCAGGLIWLGQASEHTRGSRVTATPGDL